MPYTLYNLDKSDTNLLKGLSILLITIHNFVNGSSHIAQNEMMFSIYNTQHLFGIIYYHPSSLFNSLFTYFGHYGVQVFIFLSSYGLSKKYINASLIYPKYLAERLIKIYTLLIIGIICYVLININNISIETVKTLVIFFFPITGNFSFDTLFHYVGPWWFFSLIVQLYILFPCLFFIVRKWKVKGMFILLAVAYVTIYILQLIVGNRFPVFANFPGHLPEFIFGIGLALIPEIKIDLKIFIGVVILFSLSCLSGYIFPFSFLAILIIMLYAYKQLKVSKSKEGGDFLIFIGKISMIIFVINPLVRMKTQAWIISYIHNDQELKITFFAILHTLIVIIVSYLVWKVASQISKAVKKHTNISIL